MKDIWIGVLEFLGLAWWVEVVTENPSCTYYFGPFESAAEAEACSPGYVEDLEGEGAKDIRVSIKRCKPSELTVFDENTEKKGRRNIAPVFSS